MKREYNIHSIYMELCRLIVISFLVSVIVFVALNYVGEYALNSYFDKSVTVSRKTDQKMKELQQYVTEKKIQTDDQELLDQWVTKNRISSMQIFKDEMLQYDSDYDISGTVYYLAPENYYAWETYYTITFADGEAHVFSLGVSVVRYYDYASIAELCVSFLLFLLMILGGMQRSMRYIRTLSNEIEILEGGHLDYPITIQGKDELTELAKGLDAMRRSFQQQLEEESYLTQSHKKIISEMSHDIRTPLTSLLMYTEILKKAAEEEPVLSQEKQRSYTQKINSKAHQIKGMIDHIFEYSLVSASGPVEMEPPQNVKDVFYDVLSEFTGYVKAQGFQVETELAFDDGEIRVNLNYLNRILDNITSNLLKYADPEYAVCIRYISQEDQVGIAVGNWMREHGAEEEGSHIGIRNIKNMMQSMKGECVIRREGKWYWIEILFPTS